MNTKHTPGPWKYVTRHDMHGVHDAMDNDICETFGEEAEANARLIAAAPDLLADLQRAHRIINEFVAAHQGDEGAPDEVSAYNALVGFFAPSIAKATTNS